MQQGHRTQSFQKTVMTDFLQMTLCFAGAVYAVYYAPSLFNYLYFLAIPVLFWRSKHDYFWFAFYFIIINTPAFLFFESSGEATRRLPLYSLTGGISFSVLDVFVLASLAKVAAKGKMKDFVISKPLRFVLVYFALVSIPMTFILGMENSSFFNNFRPYFYYAVLVSFYFLIDDTEDLFKFGYLMVPYVFFTLFDQLFLLTQDTLLISLINPETIRSIVNNTVTNDARAYFSGFLLVFYAFFFALQLRSNPKYELFSGLAYAVIGTALATFLLSATRVYLMIPLAVFGMYVLLGRKGGSDVMRLSVFVTLFAIVFFSLNIISFDFFLKSIWPRFEAFFLVILGGGNLAEFDTVQNRIDEDLPSIIEGIFHSPLVGTGFSGVFRQYENNDLGFVNTILIFGVVGFTLFINFFVMLFRQLNTWVKRSGTNINARTILNTTRMAMVGILLGYATTYDFFTVRQIERIYFVSILLASTEIAVRSIKNQKTNFLNNPKNSTL